jgi:hypothetical protein
MSKDLQTALQPPLDLLKQIDDAGVPKPEPASRVIARVARYAGVFPIPNIPVSLCEKSFADATGLALQEGKSEAIVRQTGKLAYCFAMPKLSGAGNIRDFVACVTYGMLMGIIPGSEGTRLLYAAQVAHTTLTKRPKKRGKSSHTRTVSVEINNLKSIT